MDPMVFYVTINGNVRRYSLEPCRNFSQVVDILNNMNLLILDVSIVYGDEILDWKGFMEGSGYVLSLMERPILIGDACAKGKSGFPSVGRNSNLRNTLSSFYMGRGLFGFSKRGEDGVAGIIEDIECVYADSYESASREFVQTWKLLSDTNYFSDDFPFDGRTLFYGIKSVLPIGGCLLEGFHLEEQVMSDEVVLNIPLRRKERTEILFELEQVDNKRRECNMSHLQRR